MKIEKLKEKSNELFAYAKELEKNARTYGRVMVGNIKKYPVQATLAAVAVGVVLGKIFRR